MRGNVIAVEVCGHQAQAVGVASGASRPAEIRAEGYKTVGFSSAIRAPGNQLFQLASHPGAGRKALGSMASRQFLGS